MSKENGRPSDEIIESRRKYVEAWNTTMLDIWKEQIIKLDIMDTGALLSSPIAMTVESDGRITSVGFHHEFLEYGLWQDYGTGLLGGLALFLYGMQMMSDGLETAAGDKMKSILEKLTANRFVAVLVGALITAIIQSSSATTVMVVGFVNAKMMTLRQAVWIIMGANIGTTITGQLIAMSISVLICILYASRLEGGN